MGPFGAEIDLDNASRSKGSWYRDYAKFVYSDYPWFRRGGNWCDGSSAGAFAFDGYIDEINAGISFRIVLTP